MTPRLRIYARKAFIPDKSTSWRYARANPLRSKYHLKIDTSNDLIRLIRVNVSIAYQKQCSIARAPLSRSFRCGSKASFRSFAPRDTRCTILLNTSKHPRARERRRSITDETSDYRDHTSRSGARGEIINSWVYDESGNGNASAGTFLSGRASRRSDE